MAAMSTEQTPPQDSQEQLAAPAPVTPRRRRRWIRFVVLLLCAVVVVVLLLPTLISSRTGVALIENAISERIAGSVQIARLSLSWRGNCSAQDISVLDVQGRQVLTVADARVDEGLFGLLVGGGDVEALTVTTTTAHLHVAPDHEVSLVAALADPATTLPLSGQAADELSYTLDAPHLTIAYVDKQLALQASKPLQVYPAGAPAPADKTLIVDDLKVTQEDQTYHITGQAQAQVTLAADFSEALAGLSGAVNVDLDSSIAPDQSNVQFSTNWRGVAIDVDGSDQVRPVNFACSGDLKVQEAGILGIAQYQGGLGEGKVEFDMQHVGENDHFDIDGLLQTILTGKPWTAPQMSLRADGTIDLAAVAGAAPGAIKLRQNVLVEKGRIQVKDLHLEHKLQQTVRGQLALSEIRAAVDGEPVVLEPVTVDLDAAVQPQRGLVLGKTGITSSFVDLRASGDMTDMQADFDARLSALHEQLNQILDLDEWQLGGELSGRLAVHRASDEHFDLQAELSATDVVVQSESTRMRTTTASLQHSGRLVLSDEHEVRLSTDNTNWNVDNQISGQLSGWYDFASGTFSADVGTADVDLAYLMKQVITTEAQPESQLKGQVALKASIQRSQSDGDVVSNGSCAVKALRMKGHSVGDQDLQIAWQSAQLNPDTLALNVEQLNFKNDKFDAQASLSYAPTAEVKEIDWDFVREAVLAGQPIELPQVTASASGSFDLPTVLALLPEGKSAEGSGLTAGTLLVEDLHLRGGGAAALRASVKGHDLTVQSAQGVQQLPDATAEMDIALKKGSGLVLSRFDFQSPVAEISAAGDLKKGVVATINGDVADLRRVGLAGYLPDELQDLDGRIKSELRIQPSGTTGEYGFELASTAENVQFGSPPTRQVIEVIKITHRGQLQLAEGQQPSVHIERLEVESKPLEVELTDADVAWTEPVSVSGRVRSSLDLATGLAMLAAINAVESAPPLAGRLSVVAQCSRSDGILSLDGSGGIDDFVIDNGSAPPVRDKLSMNYQLSLDPAQHSVKLDRLQLASRFLSGDFNGQVADYDRNVLVSVQGQTEHSFDELTELMHAVAPQTAGVIAFAGRGSGPLSIRGPLFDDQHTFRLGGLNATFGTGWAGAELYGLALGPARMMLEMDQGRVLIPKTTVQAPGGAVHMTGLIDLNAPEPVLIIPEDTLILDKVEVNRELANTLLSHINPVFGYMATVDGIISLRTRDINLPFGDTFEQEAAGSGNVDLSQLKARPAGLLAELLRLGGVNESTTHNITVSGLDFVIRNGRIEHRNFRMTFPGNFDLRFHGSVGFDDTLDLVVSVPVRQALLERLKIRDPRLVEALSDARVEIPIVGTRENPKLDLSAVDISKLIKPTLDKLPDLIDIFGGGKNSDDNTKGQPRPRTGERKSEKKKKRD